MRSMFAGMMLAIVRTALHAQAPAAVRCIHQTLRRALRDFADGAGVMSRAIVEGWFGVHPNALSGVLEVTPGLPPRLEILAPR